MSTADSSLPSFGTLSLNENPVGWGPTNIPCEFKDMPYQPFSKDTRLGRRGRRGVGGGYSYPGTRGGYFQQQQNAFGNRKMRPINERDRRWNAPGRGGQTRGGWGWHSWRGGYGANQERRQPHRTVRESSIQIKESWKLEEEMDFTRLSKLSLPMNKEPEDLLKCGEMEYYDKSYDKASSRNERPLIRVNRVMHTVTTTSDPHIRRLAKSAVGKVYLTDAIAATIMCCTRSVNPWDLVVTRINDRLFIDERDNSDFNMVSVCETAVEPPNEEPGHINSAQRLALEATFINTNICQQMLQMGGKKYAFPEPNPFIEDDDEDEDDEEDEVDAKARTKQEVGSAGYRYRLFDLGNDIQLVVRCKLDGVQQVPGSDSNTPQFVNIRALNEFDSRIGGGVDWRSKLDAQRGSVLATEIKNNSFKLARWTACSVLGGSDQLKLAFVSRVNPKDSTNHVILATQQFRPVEFSSQLNLNFANAWGILRCVIDFFMKKPTGKYVLMKDPNKPLLRIYSVPLDAFDSDADDDESESGGDDPQQEATAAAQKPTEQTIAAAKEQ